MNGVVPEMPIRILHQDDDLLVIFKPPGYHVHQPEMTKYRVPRERTLVYCLRETLGKKIYPVHRLDGGTQGVMAVALNSKMASHLCQQFTTGDVRKTYEAIVRGFTHEQGQIDIPLMSDSSDLMLESATQFRTLGHVELPYAIGKRYSTSRYSWVEAMPLTGRYHQLRRHFAQSGHPIVGDTTHGDSYHNRFFRETLHIAGLCLFARSLQFRDPRNGEKLNFHAEPSFEWQKNLQKLRNFSNASSSL